VFPGRKVLRRFVDKHLSGAIDSLAFSNLVLDKMVERSVKPEPMKVILDQIAGVWLGGDVGRLPVLAELPSRH
jgi:hypothetical protein